SRTAVRPCPLVLLHVQLIASLNRIPPDHVHVQPRVFPAASRAARPRHVNPILVRIRPRDPLPIRIHVIRPPSRRRVQFRNRRASKVDILRRGAPHRLLHPLPLRVIHIRRRPAPIHLRQLAFSVKRITVRPIARRIPRSVVPHPRRRQLIIPRRTHAQCRRRALRRRLIRQIPPVVIRVALPPAVRPARRRRRRGRHPAQRIVLKAQRPPGIQVVLANPRPF